MAYFGFAATSWAWAAPVKSSSERLVLLALAKYADDDGSAFPSADTLSDETKLNRKTVFSAITSLCEAGLIVRTVRPGQGRRNNYELKFDRTENGSTEIGTYQKRDVPKTELSMSQKRYVQSTENGTSNVPKTVREQRREQRKEQRREQRSNAPAKNSPVEKPRVDTNPNPPSLFAENEPPLPFDDVPPLDDPEGLFEPEADLPEADPDLPVIATEAQPGPESEESEEGKPKAKAKRKASDRGCVLPFETLPDEWRKDGDELAPELDPDKCWVEFKDYWRGVPGAKGRKAGVEGWHRTWCNNLRKLADWKPQRLLKEKTAQSVLAAKKKEYEGWLTRTI